MFDSDMEENLGKQMMKTMTMKTVRIVTSGSGN